jgi:hypothetical protein
VCRQQSPSAIRGNFAYSIKHRTASQAVQHVRLLVHQAALMCGPPRIWLKSAVSGNIVVPIHGTRFVAVQMRSIAGEGDQVRHRTSVYTASSRSRLIGGTFNTASSRSRLIGGTFNTASSRSRLIGGTFNTASSRSRLIRGTFNTNGRRAQRIVTVQNYEDTVGAISLK